MFLLLSIFVPSLFAQPSTNALPPLAPAYGEIPPTTLGEITTAFSEQHRVTVLTGGFGFVILVGLILWVIFRPRPPVIVRPEVRACEALAALLRQPEDGKILSEVSRVLRLYLIAVSELPVTELTTAEICNALAGREKIGADLAQSISDFLRLCDGRKFSPSPDPTPINAAARALQIVATAEEQRAKLRVQEPKQ